jgi:nitrate/TMAO reductase-like tetraheme cytochrome c subunit
MRVFLFTATLIILFTAAKSSNLKGDDNSCVSCHSELPTDTFVGSEYLDWKNSVHQEYDVTCELCHGGSPKAQEKRLAHKGVYKSGNPKSTVYFQNVPATCGGCHEEVYLEFIQSNHFRKLEKTGSGPTCGTCHGSRATWIVTPENLKVICINCHNERKGIETQAPDEARILLLALNQSVSLHEILAKITEKDGVESIKEHLNIASSKVDRAKIVWHSFDIEAVSQLLLEANDELKSVEEEVLKR